MLVPPEILYFQDGNIQPHSGAHPSNIVDQCRSLVASRYVEVGYVTEADLDENGYLDEEIDPYVRDSEYFWKADEEGRVIATLRVIHSSEENPLLPIEKSFPLFLEQHHALRKACADNPGGVVEISALAKAEKFDKFAALDMYKAVWQHAKRTGLELCAVSADIKLHNMLVQLLGDSIEVAGEPVEMMGSLTMPSFLHPNKCAEAVARIYRRRVEAGKTIAAGAYLSLIEHLIDGLEVSYLSAEEVAEFVSMGLMTTVEPLTIYE